MSDGKDILNNAIEEKYKIFDSILKIVSDKLSVKEKTSVKNLIDKKNDKTINIDSIDNAIIYFQKHFQEELKTIDLSLSENDVKEFADHIQEEKEKIKEPEKKSDIPEIKKEDKKPDNPIIEKKKEENALQKIKTNETGMVIAKDLEDQKVLAQAYLKGGLLPKWYDTVEKIITGMHLCKELDIPVLTGMKNITLINGNPTIFGDLPLALCERSKQIEDLEEFLFDDKYEKICFENKNIDKNVFGALCRVKRHGRTITEKVFTISDAIIAGLMFITEEGELSSKKENWLKYPKVMLMYRARSMSLKQAFADKLNGINIAEYDNDYLGDSAIIKESNPEKDLLLSELDDIFSFCRKNIPDFNKAKEQDIINSRIKQSDIRFADIKDIQMLIDDLKKLEVPK